MASPEEMKAITDQFKQNTEDLQSYLRDLDGWHREMGQKDEQLRATKKEKAKNAPKMAKNGDQKQNLIEEIKTSSKRKVEVKPPMTTETSKEPKEQKIKAYEYDKWDRFDVDKAMKELDAENGDGPDIEDEEDLAEARLIQESLVEKEKGNEYFKAGKFDKAIACYTKGIQCDPTSPILPANRAMALIKNKQYEAADADCTVAVSLDPTYVKAFLRRATARKMLGKTEEAIKDFEKVLQLEPKNSQAKNSLEELQKKKVEKSKTVKFEEKEDLQKSFGDNIKAAFSKPVEKRQEVLEIPEDKLEPGQILPIKKPPHTRSKKPLKRIEITEIGDVDMAEIKSQLEKPKESTPTKENTCSKSKGLQLKVEKEISEKLQTELKVNETKISRKPKTAVEFARVWKELRSDHQKKMEYLNLLEREDYPSLFKHSMEPKVFSDIISILGTLCETEREKCYNHLAGLSKVPRISAMAMFMTKEESEICKKIIKDFNDTSLAMIMKNLQLS